MLLFVGAVGMLLNEAKCSQAGIPLISKENRDLRKRMVAAWMKTAWEENKEDLGLTQESLAARIGTTQGNVGHYLHGRQMATPVFFFDFIQEMQIPIEEVPEQIVRFVVGGMAPAMLDTLSDAPSEVREMGPIYAETSNPYTYVPKSSLHAGLGDGAFELQSEQIVDHMAFKTDWLERKQLDPDKLGLINCSGDSMAPTLLDGDLVLVDLKEARHQGDGLYAIAVNHSIKVKRLESKIDGTVRVSSDNPRYEPEEFSHEAFNNAVRVIGRVVWIARDIT